MGHVVVAGAKGLVLTGLLLGLVAISAQAQDFPPGEGRDTLMRVCTQCHSLDSIPNLRYTKAQWQDLVFSMADRGADASGDELDAIVNYLSKNFGKADEPPKVNVNKASAKDIQTGLNLTDKQAQAIVSWRQEHGAFKTADDLAKVDGLDAKKIDAIKDRVEF